VVCEFNFYISRVEIERENSLIITSIIFAFLSIIFFLIFVASVKRKMLFGIVTNFTVSLLMLAISLLLASISFSMKGYYALTHEELAATIEVAPIDDQQFIANFIFPDGSTREFKLNGDELYVDAHILKWKAVVNIFGIHTAYELDRVSGRFEDIEDEKNKPRTIYTLAEPKIINAYSLRKKYEFLSWLVDTDYGSASFINVHRSNKFELYVSTTGLLIREVE
jgi:hypothetical protein